MSFANEVKRWLSPQSPGGQMALALVVTSVLAAALPMGHELLLRPASVIQDFKLWQLVSTTFVVPPSPLSLLFGVLILLQGGAWLEAQWSTRRVWLFVVVVNLLANALTVAVGFLSPTVASFHFFGGSTTIEAIWVAQGLLIGNRRVTWFGIALSGYAFAVVGAAFTLIAGLTGSWYAVVPQLFGLAIVVAWIQGYTPSRLLLMLRSRALERDLKRRASHLSVVQRPKNDRDQYLN